MGIVALVHVIPNMASLARRLHDSDKPAWWLLAMLTGIGGLLMIVFASLPGTSGSNRFGEPHAAQADDAALNNSRSAPVSPAPNRATAPPAHVDVIAELERLSVLRSNGGLSDSEYDVMKSRLLTRNA